MLKYLLLFILIIGIPVITAFNFEGDTLFNFPLEVDSNVTINQTIINATINDSRVNNLINFSCGGTDKIRGFFTNGTPICATDQTGSGGGDFDLNISNGTTQGLINESETLNLLGSVGILIGLIDNNFTFTLNFTKLNELYNDTALINAVNTTANIESLGFVTGPHTGQSLNNSFYIYFNHSMNNQITYNLTKGDVNKIKVVTQSGQKFIFGDEFI